MALSFHLAQDPWVVRHLMCIQTISMLQYHWILELSRTGHYIHSIPAPPPFRCMYTWSSRASHRRTPYNVEIMTEEFLYLNSASALTLQESVMSLGEGKLPAQHGVFPTLRLRVLDTSPTRQEFRMAHDSGQFTGDGHVDILNRCEVRGEEDVKIAL